MLCLKAKVHSHRVRDALRGGHQLQFDCTAWNEVEIRQSPPTRRCAFTAELGQFSHFVAVGLYGGPAQYLSFVSFRRASGEERLWLQEARS